MHPFGHTTAGMQHGPGGRVGCADWPMANQKFAVRLSPQVGVSSFQSLAHAQQQRSVVCLCVCLCAGHTGEHRKGTVEPIEMTLLGCGLVEPEEPCTLAPPGEYNEIVG